jgi:hypothetical protein
MKKHKKEFRNFYQEIIPKIVSEVPFIMKHFKKCEKQGSLKTGSRKRYSKRTRSTKRYRGGA